MQSPGLDATKLHLNIHTRLAKFLIFSYNKIYRSFPGAFSGKASERKRKEEKQNEQNTYGIDDSGWVWPE